ncbi:DUF4326 domain-containing protein [Nocardia nova]|uniref:DUF4326 domain-containing protein n=1 Tax=Nocardia nova TaxID=37330 RepID=UPI001895CD51|nr:DUF4326 domain-containing protein [Nocardia nova]MBF6277034.1 DUF4326 domain-containing protein [Nocardia nova]
MPERIQRRRTKGWRMPEGAVYVGRPTVYANPYKIQPAPGYRWGVRFTPTGYWSAFCHSPEDAHAAAVHLYREVALPTISAEQIAALRGHDLACWCPAHLPCHADVLIEVANQ